MARWLLEYYRIPYVEECHAPVFHAAATHAVGGGHELPTLVTSEGTWHGFEGFLSGLDAKSRPQNRLFGKTAEERQANQELLEQLYTLVFIPSRRYFYSQMLPKRLTISRVVTIGAPLFERLYVSFLYSVWRRQMRSGLDFSEELIAQALPDIRRGFDLFEARLAQAGTPFLGGQAPGVMDIAFAAMATLVILPDAHNLKALPKLKSCPKELADFITECRARPGGDLAQRAFAYRRDHNMYQPKLSENNPNERGIGVLTNPRVLLFGSNLARRLFPRLRLGRRMFISRFHDVKDVLNNDIDFRIKPINQERIRDVNDGDFILGLDRGEQHVREHRQLYAAFRPSDIPRAEDLIKSEAARLLDAAIGSSGKIDVVNGYARLVAARTAVQMLGVATPTEADLTRVIRAMFNHTFLNLGGDEDVKKRAVAAAEEFKGWVLEEIEARRSVANTNGGHFGDDVLGRMLAYQTTAPQDALDDDGVRRNISGLMVGAIDTTATSVANISYLLLTRPETRSQVEVDLKNTNRLRGWCWELLRLMPHNPLVMRQTTRSVRYGRRTLRPDTRIFALTLAAMHDPISFPSPKLLDPTRPEGNYMHFGYGLHTCAGREINRVQIPLLVSLLFSLKPQLQGNLRFDGPFPDRLVVKLNG